MFNGMTDPFVYKMAKQINNEKVESGKTSVGKLLLKFIKEKIKEKVKKEGIVKFGFDEDIHKMMESEEFHINPSKML